ncbi:hypothetical protein VC188_05250 [Polynucleobacter sp. MG-28-Ekke-A2]|uniref:hypothetical protein n=1 Tax=Polynucleobacter sp. MG-28-Ekke-A2 TaxID=3108276 RepID=UPI002B229290|nr:hypothetical protein [Polynucleobacter sp. MG-28-Ekke-A2]MEA9601526.1 hypothetical protein [Polynucleobacter sp. MG-28-Ekke-A2]
MTADIHTYWAYIYNPSNGGVYKIPIPAEQYSDALAIAQSQYGQNLRAVKVFED